MTKKALFSLTLLLYTMVSFAQEIHSGDHPHGHENEFHKPEIGVSLAPVWFLRKKP